jgi:hypothetical protein
MKKCLMCNTDFNGKRNDTLFCSNSCKAKHWRLKKEGQLNRLAPLPDINTPPTKQELTELVFNDVIETNQTQNTEKTEKEKEYKNDNNNDKKSTNTNQKINAEANHNTNLILNTNNQTKPFINKTVQVPNPNYQLTEKKLNQCRADIKTCNIELQNIEQQITDWQSKNGNSCFTIGAGSGAVLGYQLGSSENTKGKKKTDDKRLLYAFLGVILGLGAGAALKSATEESREKNKSEALQKLKQMQTEYQYYLGKLKIQEKEIFTQLQKEKPQLEKTITLLNPAFGIEPPKPSNIATTTKNTNTQTNTNTSTNQSQKLLQTPQQKQSLETDKISSMQSVAGMKYRLLNFKNKWLDFFGLPQTNFFCVIHGMSGEGKTNFSIQFAKYLAENFGNVLYISGEEGFAPTFQQKIKTLGAAIPNLYAADIRTGQDILKDVPNKYHFIIIDSINNMNIDPELMKVIRNKFKQSGIIAICQSTKDGKIRGSYQIVHDSDITVHVIKGMATTTKNRFKEKEQSFDVFEVYRKKDNHNSTIKPLNKQNDEDGLDEFRNTV